MPKNRKLGICWASSASPPKLNAFRKLLMRASPQILEAPTVLGCFGFAPSEANPHRVASSGEAEG